MTNVNYNLQDRSLMPLLYVENLSEEFISSISLQYSLSYEKIEKGFLFHSTERYQNYKLYFLDLFFVAISFYLKNPKASFFLFEKNLLRQELETFILGDVDLTSSVDYKLKQWKKRGPFFTLSGFAQATLHQLQFINFLDFEDKDLNSEELKFIIDQHINLKSTAIAN